MLFPVSMVYLNGLFYQQVASDSPSDHRWITSSEVFCFWAKQMINFIKFKNQLER